MDLKIFDFSSLFQVALGMNLAVPFFGDAMNRPFSRLRQTLDSLPALQNLMPEAERGEYLGEIWILKEEFLTREDAVRRLADRLSLVLILFAALSFAVLYYGASYPQEYSKGWLVDLLLIACFLPPVVGVVTLFLYSENRCTDIQTRMKKLYAIYVERKAAS